MTRPLQAAFRTTPTIYSGLQLLRNDFIATQRKSVAALSESPAVRDRLLANQQIVLTPNKTQTVERPIVPSVSFEEKVFNALVSLKVTISQYAMHLSGDERGRLFDALDSVINVDDWHEEDTLPTPKSFKEFLKWMIYSKYLKWTSIGVSHEGNVMVAWRTPRVLLTANFELSDMVRWTAQITSDTGEVGHTVGKCPLRLFAEQALFYLQGAAHHEAG